MIDRARQLRKRLDPITREHAHRIQFARNEEEREDLASAAALDVLHEFDRWQVEPLFFLFFLLVWGDKETKHGPAIPTSPAYALHVRLKPYVSDDENGVMNLHQLSFVLSVVEFSAQFMSGNH
jgi:hypothetical protein